MMVRMDVVGKICRLNYMNGNGKVGRRRPRVELEVCKDWGM